MADFLEQGKSCLAKKDFCGAYSMFREAVVGHHAAWADDKQKQKCAAMLKLTAWLAKTWAAKAAADWSPEQAEQWVEFCLELIGIAAHHGCAGLADFAYMQKSVLRDEELLLRFWTDALNEGMFPLSGKMTAAENKQMRGSIGRVGENSGKAANASSSSNCCRASPLEVGPAELRATCTWLEQFTCRLAKRLSSSSSADRRKVVKQLEHLYWNDEKQPYVQLGEPKRHGRYGFKRKRGRAPADTEGEEPTAGRPSEEKAGVAPPIGCLLESMLHARFGMTCVQLAQKGGLKEGKVSEWEQRAEAHFRAFVWLGRCIVTHAASIPDANFIIAWTRPAVDCSKYFEERKRDGGAWPGLAADCASLLACAEECGLALKPKFFSAANVRAELTKAIRAGMLRLRMAAAGTAAQASARHSLGRSLERLRGCEASGNALADSATQLEVGKIQGLLAFESPAASAGEEVDVPIFEDACRAWRVLVDARLASGSSGGGAEGGVERERTVGTVAKAAAALQLMAIICKIEGRPELQVSLLKLRASTADAFGEMPPSLTSDGARADVAGALLEMGRGESAGAYLHKSSASVRAARPDVVVGARSMRPYAEGQTVVQELGELKDELRESRVGCLNPLLLAMLSRLQLREGDLEHEALPEMQETARRAFCMVFDVGLGGDDDDLEVHDVEQKRIIREALGQAPPQLLAALRSMARPSAATFEKRLVRAPLLHEALFELGALWDLRGVPRLAMWCAKASLELAKSLGSGENALAERSSQLVQMIEGKTLPGAFAAMGDGNGLAADVEGWWHFRDADTVGRCMQEGGDLLSAAQYEGAVQKYDHALHEIDEICGATDDPPALSAQGRVMAPYAELRATVLCQKARGLGLMGKFSDAVGAFEATNVKTEEGLSPLCRATVLYYWGSAIVNQLQDRRALDKRWGAAVLHEDDSGGVASDDASSAIQLLRLSFQLVNTLNAPRLCKCVCIALSILYGRTQPKLATFFAHQSIGGTMHATIEQIAKEEERAQMAKGEEMAPTSWHGAVKAHRYRRDESVDGHDSHNEGEWLCSEIDRLPQKWTVCSVSFGLSRKELLITRVQHGSPPVIMRLPMQSVGASLVNKLESLVEDNRKSLSGYTIEESAKWTNKEKLQWKQRRDHIGDEFRECVVGMESSWLAHWKCLLCGDLDSATAAAFDDLADSCAKHLSEASGAALDRTLLRLMIGGMDILTDAEVAQALRDLVGDLVLFSSSSSAGAVTASTKRSFAQPSAASDGGADPSFLDGVRLDKMKVAELKAALEERGHIIEGKKLKAALVDQLRSVLTDAQAASGGGAKAESAAQDCAEPCAIADRISFEDEAKRIRAEWLQIRDSAELTWTPKIVCKDITRMMGDLSLESRKHVAKRHPVVLVLGEGLQHVPWESFGVLQHQSVTRMPSLGLVLAQVERMAGACSLDVHHARYVVNPNNDLAKTQDSLVPVLDELGGQPVVDPGNRPTVEDWKRTLSERDSLFVFCGHNSGEEFCYRHSVSRLPTCAPALMMGCNSARTDAEGQYEGQGYISAFLAAGCPAVVGNLWEVGSSDIDRFTQMLLRRCHGGASQLENGVAAVRNSSEGIRSDTTRFAIVQYGVPMEIKWDSVAGAAPDTAAGAAPGTPPCATPPPAPRRRGAKK